ncbi:MAG: transposase [Kastovskya adunca ATA6-11-RM4]|jgi:transposase|nr:transposase [Kastovskya adunca ATA6-11-RM4]
MRFQLMVHLQQMGLSNEIEVEFIYLPAYSPKLNLVEYVIHLIRRAIFAPFTHRHFFAGH